MVLYLVKDGVENVACVVDKNGDQMFNTNYYAITFNFKSNEGYIEKKRADYWRLYTQIGQKLNQSRYYKERTFEGCIKKLKELKGDEEIKIINSSQITSYSN